MLEELKRTVCEANLELPKSFALGNVMGSGRKGNP